MCHVNQYLICTNFRHLNVTRNTLLRNCYQIKELLSTCLICCWFKPKSLTNAFSGSKVILLVFARLILGKFKPMSHLEHKYLDKNICVDQERILSAGPHLVILTRPELPKSLHFVPTSPISPICISPRIIIIDANKIQSRYITPTTEWHKWPSRLAKYGWQAWSTIRCHQILGHEQVMSTTNFSNIAKESNLVNRRPHQI